MKAGNKGPGDDAEIRRRSHHFFGMSWPFYAISCHFYGNLYGFYVLKSWIIMPADRKLRWRHAPLFFLSSSMGWGGDNHKRTSCYAG